jgi:hypothetical protein
MAKKLKVVEVEQSDSFHWHLVVNHQNIVAVVAVVVVDMVVIRTAVLAVAVAVAIAVVS